MLDKVLIPTTVSGYYWISLSIDLHIYTAADDLLKANVIDFIESPTKLSFRTSLGFQPVISLRITTEITPKILPKRLRELVQNLFEKFPKKVFKEFFRRYLQ